LNRYYHSCAGCGCPGVETEFRYCSRCEILLDGLEDVTVPPPAEAPPPVLATREPGCDDRPAFTTIIACERVSSLKPKKDGKWLVWAANKRGCLRWFHTFGVQHGFPRNINQWSRVMVAMAVKAKMAEPQSAGS
jgi:hypothetical protein